MGCCCTLAHNQRLKERNFNITQKKKVQKIQENNLTKKKKKAVT